MPTISNEYRSPFESARHDRRNLWLGVIAIALLLHLILLLSIRPEFFAMFKKNVTSAGEGTSMLASSPDAIITIPIEIVDENDQPIEIDPTETQKKNTHPTKEREHHVDESDPAKQNTSNEIMNVENLLGESPVTLPHVEGPIRIAIPPRPLEITWPDTRDLKNCLGHYIDVQIQVDEKGRILDVEARSGNHPEECLLAAIDSAWRIVFEPGLVDGIPSRMWTQVRIDFRRKR